MKKILLVLMLIILFVVCGGSGKFIFILDNLSDEKIIVIIDGKEYSLDVKIYEKVEFIVGEYIVENDKYKVVFIVYLDLKGGIIELYLKFWI